MHRDCKLGERAPEQRPRPRANGIAADGAGARDGACARDGAGAAISPNGNGRCSGRVAQLRLSAREQPRAQRGHRGRMVPLQAPQRGKGDSHVHGAEALRLEHNLVCEGLQRTRDPNARRRERTEHLADAFGVHIGEQLRQLRGGEAHEGLVVEAERGEGREQPRQLLRAKLLDLGHRRARERHERRRRSELQISQPMSAEHHLDRVEARGVADDAREQLGHQLVVVPPELAERVHDTRHVTLRKVR